MGLGKTLQTICILAAAHDDQRRAGHSRNPSIVVCPPTVAMHWVNEIKKFAGKHLSTLLYMGAPGERRPLLSQLAAAGDVVVVCSYEILRSDAELLLKNRSFLYCVLDEGHVIKNAKSKIAQSVKTVRAEHRLMLSGTPIQNNVIEVWSLFDFLMPGFLGTAKQFHDRYGKPILASRDAKASSKEQEQGIVPPTLPHPPL